MRVRLTTWRVCGHGTTQRPGQEIELPDDEAQRLIAAGSAVAVAAETETTTVAPAENASLCRPKLRIFR